MQLPGLRKLVSDIEVCRLIVTVHAKVSNLIAGLLCTISSGQADVPATAGGGLLSPTGHAAGMFFKAPRG